MDYEIHQTPDQERKRRVKLLFAHTGHSLKVEEADIDRAKQLENVGFQSFDALHLACAERGQADVLPTTDDRFYKLAVKYKDQLHVRVENPIKWLSEMLK